MCALYRDWNSRINVVSRKDIEFLWEHHILHSLAIAGYLEVCLPEVLESWNKGGIRILDLGTGGGFPGIPLAFNFPACEFVLCDSIGKKIRVAEAVADALDLRNVRCVNARVESLGEKFDWVVTRAVADLSDLYPWVKGKYTGGILCLKGGDIEAEISRFRSRFQSKSRVAPKVSTWAITEWTQDPWYEGKFVIHIEG